MALVTKIRATRSYWKVEINGQTVEIPKWDGTNHRSQIEALSLAQKILVARRKGA